VRNVEYAGYADDSGHSNHSPLSRLAASGPADRSSGVLLVNPGGPGGPVLGLCRAKKKKGESCAGGAEAFDVIGFDTRGVGTSSPIELRTMGGLFDHPAQILCRSTARQKLARDARDGATVAGRSTPQSRLRTARDRTAFERHWVCRSSASGRSYGLMVGRRLNEAVQ